MATREGAVGFSIGEVSRAIGLAPQTLRLWERERLIRPRRTERGYRVYCERDVERLQKIKYCRKVEGLNFAAIRKSLGPVSQDAPDEVEDSGFTNHNMPGDRLRRMRTRSQKTLREISESTGLSISFISALERGGSGASIASLRSLASAYGIGMRELFGVDLDPVSPLTRAPERQVMCWGNGVRFEEMVSGDTVMDPSYIKVPAHEGSEGFYSHDGEEFVFVISGTLHFELGKDGHSENHSVGPGDTLYFNSATPHRWRAGDEAAEAIYVNTPPTF